MRFGLQKASSNN